MTDDPRLENIVPNSDDEGLRSVLFDGLPTMIGIVAVITQPFAQDSLKAMLGSQNDPPKWPPILVAALVSLLLAVYRLWIVRRTPVPQRVICVPLLALIIFAGYTTGNNAVFFAKEGYLRPGADQEITSLRGERDVLRQKLQSAEETLATIRRALNLPGPGERKTQSAVPSLLGFLRMLSPGAAYAQPRPQPTETRPPEKVDIQKLQDALGRYDKEQQALDQRLKEIKQQQEKARETQQQPPLIKSW